MSKSEPALSQYLGSLLRRVCYGLGAKWVTRAGVLGNTRLCRRSSWQAVIEEEAAGSGAKHAIKCEVFLRAARRSDLDAIIVWRFDRWGAGRSGSPAMQLRTPTLDAND
jgi:hypothetical protein